MASTVSSVSLQNPLSIMTSKTLSDIECLRSFLTDLSEVYVCLEMCSCSGLVHTQMGEQFIRSTMMIHITPARLESLRGR
ncbi:hypothetical protein Mapa_016571 [Marchantia paleacea]|nr:hypothetical protein Mapa_016571 [Marchantia paleacea]